GRGRLCADHQRQRGDGECAGSQGGQRAGQVDAAADAGRGFRRSEWVCAAKGLLGRMAEMGGGYWDVEIGENSEVRIQNSEERNRTQMTQICADQKVTEMMDEMFIVVLEEQVECYR